MNEQRGVGWHEKAECKNADPEIFFIGDTDKPNRFQAETQLEAKQLCGACAVKATCQEYALAVGEDHGIWGGMTTGERKSFKRRMQRRK